MAKSIRSKCKRKARAEFRRTIGDEFHKKNLAKIQEKLKDCVEKQSLKSLDRLTSIFDAAQEETSADVMDTTTATNGTIGIDAVDLSAAKELKGENKAPAKKSKRSRKHALKAESQKKKEEQPKRRPKYFVQF